MFQGTSLFPSASDNWSSPQLFNQSLTSSSPRQLEPRPGLGYLAFAPTTISASSSTTSAAIEGSNSKPADKQSDPSEDRAQRERQERDAKARSARLEAERAEALLGEFEWVRSGGMLRDARGRRDKPRTEAIRAEIRLRDKEAAIMREWDAYEARWRTLLSSSGPIRFTDIPWPQSRGAPIEDLSLSALDASKMSEFLLAPLSVRGNKVTRKERVRASWLRWHPDKMSPLLARIVPEDATAVNTGISVVMTSLKRLQDGQ